MQGRSLRNGAITQEITDTSKTYRLLGSEKFVFFYFFSFKEFFLKNKIFRAVCLESSQVRSGMDGGSAAVEEFHDIYTLAGHEASY
jgi:hypothetical protein